MASIYRSYSTDYKQWAYCLFTHIVFQLLACSQYVVVAGDINVDLLKAQKYNSDLLILSHLLSVGSLDPGTI